jgi:hypothetical protein
MAKLGFHRAARYSAESLFRKNRPRNRANHRGYSSWTSGTVGGEPAATPSVFSK